MITEPVRATLVIEEPVLGLLGMDDDILSEGVIDEDSLVSLDIDELVSGSKLARGPEILEPARKSLVLLFFRTDVDANERGWVLNITARAVMLDKRDFLTIAATVKDAADRLLIEAAALRDPVPAFFSIAPIDSEPNLVFRISALAEYDADTLSVSGADADRFDERVFLTMALVTTVAVPWPRM